MSFDDTALPRLRRDYIGTNGVNNGAVHSGALPYVVPDEYGNLFRHQTLLTCLALPVVTGNTTGISFGSKQLYTFPEGYIKIERVVAKFSLITFNTAAGVDGDIGGGGSGDYSIGSTATADGTLNSTDVDLLPSSPMLDPFVSGVGRSNAGTVLAASALFDGTATAITSYLNVIVDDADVADAAASDSVFFTGYIRITWEWHGDI